jgi:hypothetical protein
MTGSDDRSSPEEAAEVAVYTRTSPRHQTTLLVGVEGEPGMREHRGNVSVGGFFFESCQAYEPEALLELLVRLPGAGIWLRGRGRVLGCEPAGPALGVRGAFVDLELGDRHSLGEWLRSIQQACEEIAPGDRPAVVEDRREETVLAVETDPPDDPRPI